MVLCTMDAFIEAVEDAKNRLVREEGRGISIRELLRRAGYTDAERPGVQYHFNKKRMWKKGHKVPPDLVQRIAAVLPISHEELARAAHLAAGYTIEVPGQDVPAAFARLLSDDEVDEAKKQEVTARLLQIIADETARQASAR